MSTQGDLSEWTSWTVRFRTTFWDHWTHAMKTVEDSVYVLAPDAETAKRRAMERVGGKTEVLSVHEIRRIEARRIER